jgi:small conductance mechanosensitive channel
MLNQLQDFITQWQLEIMMISIFVGAFILSRLLRWLINRSFINGNSKIKADITRVKFFKNSVSFVIWLIALGGIISLIPQLRALAVTLFAGAGILIAIIGFAAQEAFSNIISGIFIVIFRPFRVGDMIKVGNLDYGIVEDVTLRHTVILDFRNKRLIIPNSIISSDTIINDSIEDDIICKFIEMKISYDSDVDLAIKIMQEESEKHPFSFDNRTPKEKADGEPVIEVRLLDFEDSAVALRAYVWAKDPQEVFRMHSDINKALKKRFDAEGIEIPFPHRTVVFKNRSERFEA